LYYANYKLGAFILRIPAQDQMLSSVMTAIKSGEESMAIAEKILSAGSLGIATFLLGGIIMGAVAAFPTYFIFLPVFSRIRSWRRARRKLKN